MMIFQRLRNQITVFMSFFLMILVLLPLFVFLFKIPALQLPASSDWVFVLFSTLSQAGLSAFISVLFGVFGSMGLCWLRERQVNMLSVELFCLLPALLPPLVPVLSWVNVSEWLFHFPFFSFYSVLVAHVLMNTGLVSVFFFRLFCAQTGQLSDWAFLHKISRWGFLKKMLFFEWRKDLLLVFLLVFSFCFTSFSVPLLVGGGSGQTLEVFIAEKLKDPATWPEAMTLFAIEIGFVFLFFSLLYTQMESGVPTRNRKKKLYLIPSLSFLVFPILPSLLIFFGLWDLWSGSVWRELLLIKNSVFISWTQTLLVGVLTGVGTLFLLSGVAFCLRDFFLRRFLIAYCGSSTAFMGFAFLLIGSDSPAAVWLKWSVGLSLLFLPALYRLMGETILVRLKNQVRLVDLMGAGRVMSFTRIIWPQCRGGLLFLSGIAAFWACGDFAYSSIVGGGQEHLALLIQELFASYRFELATILTWLLILSGVFCFFLFAGVAFVLHKKSYLPAR